MGVSGCWSGTLQRIEMYFQYMFFRNVFRNFTSDHLKADMTGGSMGGCGTHEPKVRVNTGPNFF
jgi:hypothetical protein